MAYKQYTLVLTGVAQRVSTVLANSQVGGPQDVACRQIVFAMGPANGAPLYVGSDNTVSATNHAFVLGTPVTQGPWDRVTIGPFSAGPVKLSDFWVLGTANERLMIGLVPF